MSEELIRPMTVSERLDMRLRASPGPGNDNGYTMYPNRQLRMDVADAKSIESELVQALERVRQLEAENDRLRAGRREPFSASGLCVVHGVYSVDEDNPEGDCKVCMALERVRELEAQIPLAYWGGHTDGRIWGSKPMTRAEVERGSEKAGQYLNWPADTPEPPGEEAHDG